MLNKKLPPPVINTLAVIIHITFFASASLFLIHTLTDVNLGKAFVPECSKGWSCMGTTIHYIRFKNIITIISGVLFLLSFVGIFIYLKKYREKKQVGIVREYFGYTALTLLLLFIGWFFFLPEKYITPNERMPITTNKFKFDPSKAINPTDEEELKSWERAYGKK